MIEIRKMPVWSTFWLMFIYLWFFFQVREVILNGGYDEVEIYHVNHVLYIFRNEGT